MSDIVFQGTSAIALDAKGRITVPVRQRELLMQACDGQLTLTRHQDGFLAVLPRPVWLAFRQKLIEAGARVSNLRRLYLGSAVDLEIDGAGRVLIPPELRAAAGLGKDVWLMGSGDRLELWDPQRQIEHEARQLSVPVPEDQRDFCL